jgi:hypothetical protein
MRFLTLLAVLCAGSLCSDIARVYPAGKELAVSTSTLTVVAVNGKELGVVAANGKEQSKGGQDLAR